MATPKSKANIGMTLLVVFLATIATGIILHLKTHGIVVEPRPVIKTLHWTAGFLMVGFACWHGLQFQKMLSAMKTRFRWFWCDTWVLIVFLCAALITGLIKLLSPVKIPHLGLWYYWCGIIMIIAAAVHLIRGIHGWNRLRKTK